MKPHAIVSAVTFAALSAISAGSFAADAEKPPVKPHSHMQEKTGVAPKAADAAPEEKKTDEAKANKAKDKTKDRARHLHPRDGK